ncbi:MAG: hypothetical protein V1797_00205 [Pseudomonadota bacterium]
MGSKPGCGCIIGLLLLLGLAPAWAEEKPAGGERGDYKKITVACLRDGQPVSPCEVSFRGRNAPYGYRCVTASSGICQVYLMCCKQPDKTPIDYEVTATSLWGMKKGSQYTNCGWTCDEAGYLRFDFTGMKKE